MRTAQPNPPLRIGTITGITIRHIHATADVVLDGAGEPMREHLAFVRDGGRWYVYETLERCPGNTLQRRANDIEDAQGNRTRPAQA